MKIGNFVVFLIASSFVLCLYFVPAQIRSLPRDNPTHVSLYLFVLFVFINVLLLQIYSRQFAVFCVSVSWIIVLYFNMGSFGFPESVGFFEILGMEWGVQNLKGSVIALLLMAIFYLGR